MVDKLTPEARSENMRRIRSGGTKPEMAVRRLAHQMGYRFRLHRRDLPGKPDLVFGPRKKVIFVHGCFWHGHDADTCPDKRTVKSNGTYWVPKLLRNRERDAQNELSLRTLGWKVLTVWECETRDKDKLSGAIRDFLE